MLKGGVTTMDDRIAQMIDEKWKKIQTINQILLNMYLQLSC